MLAMGPRRDGAGAPCVTWVLDELVVGDNISDRVSHNGGSAVASMFEGRPARMLAGTPVAGADRETTRDV